MTDPHQSQPYGPEDAGAPYPDRAQYPPPGYPGQTYPAQPHPGQTPPGQTYPGQVPQGQPYPAPQQPYPGGPQGQPYPGGAQGQPYPGGPQGQPYPGPPQQPYPGAPYPASPYPAPPVQGFGGPYGQGPRPPAPPRRTGRTVLFVALGLVGLLILGGGTAWFVASRGGAPAGGAAAGTWKVPFAQPDSSDFDGELMFASWLTDTAVVRVQRDGVLAYAFGTGKRVWGTPAPSGSLCGATPTLQDGKGVIAYGGGDACDHLAGIDARTGKVLWKAQVAAEKRLGGSRSIEVPELALAGDVVIAQPGAGLRAYRLSDGKGLWRGTPPSGCRSTGLGAGAKVVVVTLNCFPRGATYGFEPATGKIKWKFDAPDEGPDMVLSADPPVLMSGAKGQRFTVLDEAGKQVSDFSPTEEIDLLSMSRAIAFEGGNEHLRMTVHGDTLYLATFSKNVPGKLRSRDYAVAFDMRGGKPLWKSSGGSDCKLNFIRADDKGVLALETGDHRDLAPRVVRIDAATGKTQAVAELPLEFGHEGEDAEVFERDGTVVIVPWAAVVAKNAISVVNTSHS
ncbi:outer membrane protein assembly factor BamB family protein [Sphaerisporangium perillae]|uniref:outer membrane protein assembly factor BamB family protein n=1 Tax=Sphaerisporangium perillae TaxID=2935860 RepID=UPI00200F5EB6|nr:PQQ-binding-like beta-propeller repeat protein [Sphaerisporangium perillae]